MKEPRLADRLEGSLQRLGRRPPPTGYPFASLHDLAERILSFQDRYNTTAEPLDWRHSRDDVKTFLTRLAAA